MRRTILALTALFVCGMMVAPIGFAGKPQPPPTPTEPFGTIHLDDSKVQFVMTYDTALGNGTPYHYGVVKLHDWNSQTGLYEHSWSGLGLGGCTIGDVDNDGHKEVVAANVAYTWSARSKTPTSTTWYLNIWENGDDSFGASYNHTMAWGGGCADMRIANVDSDSALELIIDRGVVEIWDFTYDASDKPVCTLNAPSRTISDNGNSIGTGAMKIGDSDNDNQNEILIGQSLRTDGNRNRGVVIDYSAANGGSYSLIFIGYSQVLDMTVGNFDGDAYGQNEVFLSGWMGGRVLILKYIQGQYTEIWNHTYTTDSYGPTTNLCSNGAADIDHDGKLELLSGRGNDYTGKGNGIIWWFRWFIWEYDGNGGWTEYTNIFQAKQIGQTGTLVTGNIDADQDDEMIYDGLVMQYSGTSNNPALTCVQQVAFTPVGSSLALG